MKAVGPLRVLLHVLIDERLQLIGLAAAVIEAVDVVVVGILIVAQRAGPSDCLQAAALPTFFSPFTWRLIRQQANGYELRDIRLGRGTISPSVFLPSESDRWVAEARATRTARVFLNFSRMPATRSAVLPDGGHRVRFMDVRFVGTPGAALKRDPQASRPFAVTVDIAPDGAVRSERLGN